MIGKRRVRAVLIGWAGIVLFTNAHTAVKRVVASNPGASVSFPIWVYFFDKSAASPGEAGVSPRALARRCAAGYREPSLTDQVISSGYLHGVEAAGGRLRHCFKWENAASFDLPVSALYLVKALPFVTRVELVGKYLKKTGLPAAKRIKRTVLDVGMYGTAFEQLAMLALPQAHEYLRHLHPSDEPGKGVRIAFFDSGFRLDHRCFRHLSLRGAVKGTWDFIDRDSMVADPDSVNTMVSHPLHGNDEHGTEAFSLVAAFDPPYYCGSAWGADFLLARTEDTFIDSSTDEEHELHVEEDNWAAAVVWAESLGVDIISSSLGYRYDFQDTIIIEREGGLQDTIVDYLKSDLNGRTTIVSRAARGAIARGVLIVNSAGNERSDGDTSLSAPADVDGVIAVGSINSNGSLSSFSSLGPSADGRLKPDVVAPGHQIYLPDIFKSVSIGYSITRSGTSFAAPFVAGVCALIKQAFPDSTAQQVSEKLYHSCRLLPWQTMADNAFGRGIPDALRSCMRWDDEVFLSAVDTGGQPLANAYVISRKGDTLTVTTNDGNAIFRLPGEQPTFVNIGYGSGMRRVTIDSTPCRTAIAPCSLVVSVCSRQDKPLPLVTIRYRIGIIERTITGDTLGNGVITGFLPGPLVFTAAKAGYVRSDTIAAFLGERRETQTICLQARGPLFEVYPTVFRRRRADRLIIRFVPETDGSNLARRVNVSVRSVNGALVWKEEVATDGTPVTLHWDGICHDNRSRAAPGIYFLMLSCDEERHRTKFIIAE